MPDATPSPPQVSALVPNAPSATPAPATPAPVAEVAAAYAEPISPATAKRFPHLKTFTGHILIGGRTTQVVLAGVGPADDPTRWQPAGLAVFQKRGARWERSHALGAFDLRRDGRDGRPYRASAVDVGVDAEKGLAFATFVFTSGASPRMTASYRLDGERLAVELGALKPSDRQEPGTTPWSMRLRATGISHLVPPTDEYGPMRGTPYLVRYRGDDVIALIGHRPFDVDDAVAETTLTPARAPGVKATPEGFDLLIGRQAAARVGARHAQIRACAAALKLSAGACKEQVPTGEATLTLASDDVGGAQVAQPVYVFDADGRVRAYTALFAGESMTVAMPAASPLRLADTRSGRMFAGLEPWTPDPGKAATLALPPRSSGRVRVNAPAHGGAAVLTLNRLDQPRGEGAVLEIVAPAGTRRLSPATFLVESWPLELRLVAGGYAAELSTGGEGTFCSFRMQVRDGRPAEYECPKTTYTTGIPGADAARLADLATLTPAAAVARWQRLLGVSLVAVDQPAGSGGAVYALRAVDPDSGMELSFAPATKELAERWAETPEAKSDEPLPAFAALVRGSDANQGVLELSCPVDGMAPFEYDFLAQQLKPDALRLFGCMHGSVQTEWLELVGRMTGRRGSAYALTAVPALEGLVHGAFYPRLALPADASGTPASAAWVGALRAGRHVLGAGASVEVKAWERPGANHHILTVDVATTPEIRARHLVVYTERGQLLKKALEPRAPTTQTQKVDITLPHGAQFIRIELRGTARRASVSQLFDRGAGVLLATTNFLDVRPARGTPP